MPLQMDLISDGDVRFAGQFHRQHASVPDLAIRVCLTSEAFCNGHLSRKPRLLG
jgi:hypothetical protein